MKRYSTIISCALLGAMTLSPVATVYAKVKAEVRTAQSIVAALRHSGLPVKKFESYTATNDPNKLLGRPGYYTSKTNFVDKRTHETVSGSIDVIDGGSVEVFRSSVDARNRFEYLTTMEKQVPMLAEYDYLDGNVVLRVSHDFAPAQAKAYDSIFIKILSKK